MIKKFLSQLEVGDYAYSGKTLYRVIKTTPTTLTMCDTANPDLKYRNITVRKSSGKVIGHSSRWVYPLETTPEEFQAKIAAENAAKKAKEDEREARYQEKVELVKQANPSLEIAPLFKDLNKAEFVNSVGKPGLILFSVREEPQYDYVTLEEKPGFRIQPTAYVTDTLGHREEYGFSTPSSFTASSVVDALYDLIASYYWER